MDFFYTDKIPAEISLEMAEKLLALGEMFDLPKLKHLAEEDILPCVSVSTAVFYLVLGDTHNSIDLKGVATRVILTNFPEIAKTDDWTEFAKEKPELMAEIMTKLAKGYKIFVLPENDTC